VVLDELGFARHSRIAHEKRGEQLSAARIGQTRDDAVLVDVVASVDERHLCRRQNIEQNAIVR
jgi:hypothetical protein